MSTPIPYWRGDADYYPRQTALRASHMRQIEAAARIDRRIAASAGDGSYAVLVTVEEMVK